MKSRVKYNFPWKFQWNKFKFLIGPSRRKFFVILIASIILGLSVFWFFQNKTGGLLKKDSWQAVFLQNDQVYFGKLAVTDDFYILRHVYYLKSEEDKLTTTASGSVDIGEDKKSKTTLVKLGNELHGPEDEMFIEKSKVMFWENLKESSSIVRSIKNYENTNP